MDKVNFSEGKLHSGQLIIITAVLSEHRGWSRLRDEAPWVYLVSG